VTGPSERLSAAIAARYRIERELGQGGMATVYLAEDLKHKRRVAVKVLKPELAAVLGAERFVQEITTTASLQHPHILPLFDSGEADGFLYYVMPFIDGETLRAKLDREKQLGVDEAVKIATEVADALHYAHAQGVIHRDIKPENILLANGRPMVADFGIALAVSAAAGGRMTETGLSLGTPHYMSPEQATAEKEITARSDVYSLASVLYEMLAGEPPHMGNSAQQIIMKIIAETVAPVTKLRKAVPGNVAAALTKALEKLPADRFASAKEFADALGNTSYMSAVSASAKGGRAAGWRDRAAVPLAVAAGFLLVVAAWGWLRPAESPPIRRYHFVPTEFAGPWFAMEPEEAPDGSFVIFIGPTPDSSNTRSLWIRRRDEVAGKVLPGTVGVDWFVISPDGREVAFSAAGALRIASVSGGVVRTVVASGVSTFGGAAWLDDGTLVISWEGTGQLDLAVVPASGGTPRILGLSSAEGFVLSPSPVHGRRAFLYSRCGLSCEVRAHGLDDRTDTAIADSATGGVYAVSGHVLFRRQASLLARRFDAERLVASGPAVTAVNDVQSNGLSRVTLSRSGTLIFVLDESGGGSAMYQMVWVDRRGAVTVVDPAWEPFHLAALGAMHGWALSPDESQLALGVATDAGDDIWIKQMPSGAFTRLTDGYRAFFRPRWTPDGRSVYYLDNATAVGRRADGVGPTTRLDVSGTEVAVSPDSQWLIFRTGGTFRCDIFGRRLTGTDTSVVPILTEAYCETAVSLSPDGRWLLYVANETGRNEVYVRPFPDWNRLRLPVSVGGGEAPLWSRDGKEIFYLSPDNRMMAVRFTAAATPTVAAPVALFAVPPELLAVETAFYTPWDVAADGRFLMARRQGATGANSYPIVTENFLTVLRERVGR
jgi:serine/threonine-protein kinase